MSNFKEYWSDKSSNYDYPMPAAKDVWEHQQAQFAELNAQLNNMEQCYIGMKKERDDLQERVNSTLGVCTENRLCIGKFMIEDETLELISDVEKALRGEP